MFERTRLRVERARYLWGRGALVPVRPHTRGDRLVGYFVGRFQEEAPGVRVGYVLDVAAEDRTALRALLCRGLVAFQAAGADWPHCGLLPHPAVGSLFSTLGFRRDAGEMPTVYAIYDETLEGRLFEDRGQWDLCLGDSDIFTDST